MVDGGVTAATQAGDEVPVIVTLEAAGPSTDAAVAAVAADAGVDRVDDVFATIDAVAAVVDDEQLDDLAADPRVISVEPDRPVFTATDTARSSIGIPQVASEYGLTGDAAGDGAKTYSNGDVVVAVVDTGINRGHLALDEGKVRTQVNFSNCSPSGDDWDDSDNGHGTHVAGIVAGDGDIVSGIAPAAALLDVKVLCGPNAGGDQSDVNAALSWLLANGAAWGVDAVNLSMSLGGSCGGAGTDSSSRLANQLVAAGIVVTAAVGNDPACPGPAAQLGTATAPGSAAHVLGIGAVADPGDLEPGPLPGWRVADFSLRGPTLDGRLKPDLVAPGDDIRSAAGNGTSGTVVHRGTSMASPMVAAVAGLLAELSDALRPFGTPCGGCASGVVDGSLSNPVKSVLQRTATDWGLSGPDNDSGWGIVDAYRAVSLAAGSLGGSPQARACTLAGSGLVGGGGVESWTVVAQGGVPVIATTVLGAAQSHQLTVGAQTVGGTLRSLSAGTPAAPGQVITITVRATGAAGFGYALELSGASRVTKTATGALAGSCTAGPAGRYVPLGPVRALDTRLTGGPLAGGTTRDLSLLASGVPADAVGVVLNVTVTGSTASSFVSVFPAGSDRPPTSTVNMVTGQVVANAALLGLGPNGTVTFYNNFGNTHVVVDVYGYYAASATAGFVSLAPTRLVDTRLSGGALGPGATRRVQVTPAVPPGAAAAILNVTVDQPTGAGFLSLYPGSFNGTSSVNFVPGSTVPNLVTVPLAADGSVEVRNSWGNTHVIVDLLGYYQPGGGVPFHPVRPARVLDTRNGTGGWLGGVGSLPINQDVTDLAAVPAAGVAGIAVNVTATQASLPTHVTVWPSGQGRPGTSNVNVPGGGTAANLVAVGTGPLGYLWLAGAVGTTHLVVDVTGYFG